MPRWGHSGTFSSRRHRCLLSTQAGGLVVGGVVGSWLASARRATRTRTHSLADQTERFARAKTEGNARYLPPLPPPPPSPSPPPTCATNLFRCSSQGHERSVQLLLSAKADVDHVAKPETKVLKSFEWNNPVGKTALMIAAVEV